MVDFTGRVDTSGTDNTPNDCSGEEGVVTRAGEMSGLMLGAEPVDVFDLPVDNLDK